MFDGKSNTARLLRAYMVKDIDPGVPAAVCWCAQFRGEKIPAKSAQTALSHCDHHMFTNYRAPTAQPAKLAVEGEGKSWWCIRAGSWN